MSVDEEALLEEKDAHVLFPVARYRGEKVKYTWTCIWDEIK